jgi:RNA polymerase sigma-70 factor, ECF subfamily
MPLQNIVELDPPLVERSRQGDRAAFEQLYRRHVGRVYATVLRLAGDPVRAEEWTQDAFVTAWQKLDRFHGNSRFSTWLHRVAVNTALGGLRSDMRRDDRIQLIDADAIAPTGALERGDLERSIASLPARARAVFVLHEVDGYQHADIASLMGISTGTSKSQLHRARSLLRERLS